MGDAEPGNNDGVDNDTGNNNPENGGGQDGGDNNNNGGTDNNNGGGQDGGDNNNEGGQDGGQNEGDNNSGDSTTSAAEPSQTTDSPDTPDDGDNNGGGEASVTQAPDAPAQSTTTRRRKFRNKTRTGNRGGESAPTQVPDTNENIVSSAAPETTEAPAVNPDADLGNIGGGGGRDLEVSQPAENDTPTPTSVEATDPVATTVETEGPSAPSVTAVPVDSGDLGGEAPPVLESGKKDRPFCVKGNTFANAGAAVQRACDIQFNKCADAANADQLDGKTIQDCEAQKARCGRGRGRRGARR